MALPAGQAATPPKIGGELAGLRYFNKVLNPGSSLPALGGARGRPEDDNFLLYGQTLHSLDIIKQQRIGMNEQIGKEELVHGEQWGELHGGYFSDQAIAQPFVDRVKDVLMESRTDVVVDLGGGTGFLLSQLAAQGLCGGLALVNLDGSDVQLASARKAGITCVRALITDFQRRDVGPEDKRFFFIMRSVLHYFGEAGLLPVLLHLHRQAKKSEVFVHQTASFEDKGDAACLNALYRHMHSDKWYPTVRELKSSITKAGWRVTDLSTAPALLLTSDDLAIRYKLEMDDVIRIRNVMAQDFGGQTSVFGVLTNGFWAKLHYRIYTCVAY